MYSVSVCIIILVNVLKIKKNHLFQSEYKFGDMCTHLQNYYAHSSTLLHTLTSQSDFLRYSLAHFANLIMHP